MLFRDVKQIYKQVGLSESEAQTLMDIEKSGVKLYFQMQSTDRKDDFINAGHIAGADHCFTHFGLSRDNYIKG